MLRFRHIMFDHDVWWLVQFREDSKGRPRREMRILARSKSEAIIRTHLCVGSCLIDPVVRLEREKSMITFEPSGEPEEA